LTLFVETSDETWFVGGISVTEGNTFDWEGIEIVPTAFTSEWAAGMSEVLVDAISTFPLCATGVGPSITPPETLPTFGAIGVD
jgi:hypothetical protein